MSAHETVLELETLLAQETYHWRSDPLRRKSDWILEVRVIEELAPSDDGYADDLSLATCSEDNYSVFPIELYHIHKGVMVLHRDEGRRSKFFLRIFASSNMGLLAIRNDLFTLYRFILSILHK